tara:strand:- start:2117 stop:2347 length:231 start_codon:yes stop_codon:yes gene_type:complete
MGSGLLYCRLGFVVTFNGEMMTPPSASVVQRNIFIVAALFGAVSLSNFLYVVTRMSTRRHARSDENEHAQARTHQM